MRSSFAALRNSLRTALSAAPTMEEVHLMDWGASSTIEGGSAEAHETELAGSGSGGGGWHAGASGSGSGKQGEEKPRTGVAAANAAGTGSSTGQPRSRSRARISSAAASGTGAGTVPMLPSPSCSAASGASSSCGVRSCSKRPLRPSFSIDFKTFERTFELRSEPRPCCTHPRCSRASTSRCFDLLRGQAC